MWCDTSGVGRSRVPGPVLGIHLGMSGKIMFADGRGREVDGGDYWERGRASGDHRFSRFGLTFADGSRMVLIDPRRLGRVRLDPPVEKLGPDGSLVWTADSMGSGQVFTDQPSGIDVGADGRVYVSVNRAIQVYDADGNPVAQWTGSENGGTGLSVPYGVLLDGAGAVLVADAALNQVRAFELIAPADPG